MNSHFPRVTHIAGRLASKWFLALLILVAVLLAGMYLGHLASYEDAQIDAQSATGMRSELAQLRQELKVATGDLQLQRTLHEVDRRALEMVRSEMASQKERTAELEEDLRFYRSLVAPDDTANGLSLRPPEVVSSGRPRHFNFRFVVQLKARKLAVVEGTFSVTVFGMAGEKEVSYPLQELSPGISEGFFALNFRYFQTVEGELVLPEGFEPRGITIEARASRPRAAEVSEQYPWTLQERFNNVGK